jgi:hypothetical protein
MQNLSSMNNLERYGLKQFKKDHIKQYHKYLKGLQLELEMGDFYGAK